MPISVDERDALRNLVTWTRDELATAGNPDNALASLQALTDQRLAEYQTTVDTMEAEVLALIEANPAAHDFWLAAQDAVWVRLKAALPESELILVMLNPDPVLRTLSRGLPLLASLQWTLTNWQNS